LVQQYGYSGSGQRDQGDQSDLPAEHASFIGRETELTAKLTTPIPPDHATYCLPCC
jgi:hypothetical protein